MKKLSATAFQRKRRLEKLKLQASKNKTLDEMTIKELISFAKQKNIDLGELKKKADILEKINSELNLGDTGERKDNAEA